MKRYDFVFVNRPSEGNSGPLLPAPHVFLLHFIRVMKSEFYFLSSFSSSPPLLCKSHSHSHHPMPYPSFSFSPATQIYNKFVMN